MTLLPSQKNLLFDLIPTYGFSNSQFHFDDLRSNASIIKFGEVNYYFLIENAFGGWQSVKFCPGSMTPEDLILQADWNIVLSSFAAWLGNLKREAFAEDKWARLEQEIKSSHISFETESDKFSAGEYEDLKTKIFVLKERVKSIPLEPAQLEAISNKLDHLIEQGKTLSKFDWKSMFVGTIISIIIQLSVSPANAKALWDLIKQVFSGYFLN